MEPLIIVFSYHGIPGSNIERGEHWAWLKRRKEFMGVVQKNMPKDCSLDAAWSCTWKEAPSRYQLEYGYAVEQNLAGPKIDFAAKMRDENLRKPKPNIRWLDKARQQRLAEKISETLDASGILKEKPHIRLIAEQPKKPKPKRWVPYTVYEADARAVN